MNLPKEINPNPLAISTIEIRFDSKVEPDKVLSTFFPLFSDEFPKLKSGRYSRDIKEKNTGLKYSSDYIFENEKYAIGISNCVMIIENLNEYKLWSNFSEIIKTQLDKLFSLDSINTIERVGVRVANIFEGDDNINEILNFVPLMNFDSYRQEITIFRTNFFKDDIKLHLQIGEKVRITNERINKSGTYIDIDASVSNDLPINITLFETIETMHIELKKLFFFLIREDYLKNKLNPKY